jgi:hypothetical protein
LVVSTHKNIPANLNLCIVSGQVHQYVRSSSTAPAAWQDLLFIGVVEAEYVDPSMINFAKPNRLRPFFQTRRYLLKINTDVEVQRVCIILDCYDIWEFGDSIYERQPWLQAVRQRTSQLDSCWKD